jgi:hypothetical protein
MKMMIEMKSQSSFRWRLMRVAHDAVAKTASRLIDLIMVSVKANIAQQCDAVAKMTGSQIP